MPCAPADLGPGFHLVPVREHCRVGRTRRLSQADRDTASRLAWEWTRDLPDWTTEYRATRARIIADYERTNLWRSQQEREALRATALSSCDPMALQAARVLRAVLADILNGDDQ